VASIFTFRIRKGSSVSGNAGGASRNPRCLSSSDQEEEEEEEDDDERAPFRAPWAPPQQLAATKRRANKAELEKNIGRMVALWVMP